ncbi:MAG: hypothetical protein L3J79_11945 [Candidatus Marinimicrobia bacterium]|nr:hypothetical protein [Candidatus Neomarinimicrobiota bacterium]
MAYIWKALIGESEISSVLFRLLLGISYWFGINSLLFVLVSGIAALVSLKKLLLEPSLILRLVDKSIHGSVSQRGLWAKWYLISICSLIPLLLALQAFGMFGRPWVPSTRSDWLLACLYLISQLPIILFALISLQIKWIYDVHTDGQHLRCSLLWIEGTLDLENPVLSGKLGSLVFVIPRKTRVPLFVWVSPENDTES